MANEAVMTDRISEPLNFNCSELAMTKGAILALSGARDVKLSAADNDVAIGILGRDKIVGDGRTSVPVFTQGIFRCASRGVIVKGSDVTISGANLIKAYTTLDREKGYVLGRALEAGDGDDNIEVMLG